MFLWQVMRMDAVLLRQRTDDFVFTSRSNRIPDECACEDGQRFFDSPLIGIGAADDELFAAFRVPEAVGAQFMMPEEWLPGARSVISLFFPFTEAVRESNSGGTVPSKLWLYGRIEGQQFIAEAGRYLAGLLRKENYKAVVPCQDERFRSVSGGTLPLSDAWHGKNFTSSWSERHVAFLCGLGTFGLSRGIITEKGMAGRLVSIVTDAYFKPDVRKYKEIYEYCILCGACAGRCPAGAISKGSGKDHVKCAQYLDRMEQRFSPRYGCGKCQAGVPCSFKRPDSNGSVNRK